MPVHLPSVGIGFLKLTHGFKEVARKIIFYGRKSSKYLTQYYMYKFSNIEADLHIYTALYPGKYVTQEQFL